MDGTKPECPEGIGSVKAAFSLYGERIHGRKADNYRTHIPLTEPSKTGGLEQAKLDVGRVNERKKFAGNEKAWSESELYRARSAANELAKNMDDSNANARARRVELQQLRRHERSKGGDMNDRQYPDVLQELRIANEELSQLKLDMASALEAKLKIEEEIEATVCRAKSHESFAEELRKEIEEADEEHVLVELARMEVERELREIEAQRGAEATQFFTNMEIARKKINDLCREVNRTQELQIKLAATNSDVNILQKEMELVRATERNTQKDAPARAEDGTESSNIEAELKAAKKELESAKEDGFQFLASMDRVREELMHIAKETERLKKLENKADSTVQSLNFELLKAKTKLESAVVADERAKATVSNLSGALQRLQTETEAAKKDKEAICKETETMTMEIKKTDLGIKSAEEGLEAALEELGAVKALEAVAMRKLRHASKRTKENRDSGSLHSPTFTISKSEYDYLTSGAAAAQVVADKKAAAAQAWIKALKAGEREILMKCKFIEREIKKLRIVEEQEVLKTEKSLVTQRTFNEAAAAAEASDMALAMPTPRKSIRVNGIPAAARRAQMIRLSASPGTRHNPRSPSFTIKKRTKVMPSLSKFLRT